MHLPNLQEARSRTKKEVSINRYSCNIEYYVTNKNYLILTYGCQMNVHDSENIKALLESVGYNETTNISDADIIVINTCAIRENAHNKVFGMLGRLKKLKENNPNLIICMCGCMPQEEHISLEIRDKYKYVDIVFGTHNIYQLPQLLKEYTTNQKQIIEVYSIEGNVIEGLPVKRDSQYKAWINIMYGCDKFCTYCIVPFTRGKQRSRLKEDILNEITALKNDGYIEVTLLGQNVNAYGKDLYSSYNLAALLTDVSKIGIKRIRFVTSHPWDFTDEMIDVIAKYDNIMPYIHLPIQSGSNSILKKMGRRYTKEEYIVLFNKIKQKIKNVSISTDIIVGFPNETDKDFEDTLSIVKQLQFDLAYTFIFSKRVSTVAYTLEDSVDLATKKQRLAILNKLVNESALNNNKKYLGKTVDVLIEGYSAKDNKLMGYTDTMKLVNLKGGASLIGKIKKVKITNIKTWSLDGEIDDR
ncbi:MAG: tRNA (N6-isopentenyl adenosine(37)-C2)-methylthiotransferase MiaB [bacterium]|nr:tRNA (N6-isopentenyl adenosine(37)-C2)-methylthiotransferase MiaB [bacterium]